MTAQETELLNSVLKELAEIKSLLANTSQVDKVAQEKPMLSIEDCAELTGLSKGHLYKLTSQNVIPFYKPNGCRIYFKREEVIEWLQSNRVKTNKEISKEVSSRMIRGQRH
ncbi:MULTISPECIES: helix-turn-helix domain-containing protein [Shewanella]|uniref:helix-turn-helix domain-containing protein n=1 Tax=Shewanella TaxID=22 RepID=UPI002857FDDB|nr:MULTISPECIES: helix-turn-helix domain-containing protein [Shewanella]MDR6965756.1 excisionase family DNA binding protein [Shewanella putrefaciens]WVI93415.1 helix-turn-helix domain-containing protein [Shewanella oncorhynchi]